MLVPVTVDAYPLSVLADGVVMYLVIDIDVLLLSAKVVGAAVLCAFR